MDKNTFVEKAKKIHGDKYLYDKFEYRKYKEKVIVTCKIHGDFKTRIDHFLKGHGCPECFGSKKMTTDIFIEKAKKVHGDKYDYSKVEYVNNHTKVCIICPKHGEFWQTPNSHLSGKGCPKCKNEKISERCNKGIEQFIIEAKKIHGDKYDYSNVVYKNNKEKVKINCKIHGQFFQSPYNHLKGQGCPICRYEKNAKNQMMTTDEFIEKAKKIHGDKYDYSKVIYNGYESYVKIICPNHGEFLQTPDSHLHSGGCPKCGVTLSKNEDEIYAFLKELMPESGIIQRDRVVIRPKEIDIYIPSMKIGIEYNGLFWHSDKSVNKNYHLEKLEACNKNGINLIQIFEDEYINHKEIVLSKLRHIFKKDNLDKIMGRKCIIKVIDSNSASCFLEKNHIQGYRRSTIHYGAFFEGKLIAVMSFNREIKNSNIWELTRFASDFNYICQGVGGKLFKTFIKENNPYAIKSFLDRRWCFDYKNNFYTKVGFKFENFI